MNGTTLLVLLLVFAAGFALGKFDAYLRQKRKRDNLLDVLERPHVKDTPQLFKPKEK